MNTTPPIIIKATQDGNGEINIKKPRRMIQINTDGSIAMADCTMTSDMLGLSWGLAKHAFWCGTEPIDEYNTATRGPYFRYGDYSFVLHYLHIDPDSESNVVCTISKNTLSDIFTSSHLIKDVDQPVMRGTMYLVKHSKWANSDPQLTRTNDTSVDVTQDDLNYITREIAKMKAAKNDNPEKCAIL